MSLHNENQLMKQSLERAISVAGSQTALAQLVGVTPQAVQQWVKRGRVSRKSAKAVSNKTGISLHDL
ncbi:MAG: helix-turn-helix domain-containing protein [Nitrosomonas sp.]|nr:helix-turn-helix domain-containing protein [Nitrosomonas sp.]